MTAGLLGEARCREVAERVLAAARADQAEVVITVNESALTRFAESAIHQNVHETDASLRVRVVLGQRVGVAATNDLSADGLAQVVARVKDIAEHQREDPEFPGLPGPAPITPVPSFDAATAAISPGRRAAAVKTICDLALDQGLTASGAFSTGSGELAVANSLGVWAYERSTRANLKTVVMGDDEASGYSERTSRRVDDLDAEALGREAVDRARRGRNPVDLEPGEYPVVLEEYAVGEALDYLSYMGFGALSLQQGESFLTGRLGEQVVSEQISIWDDGSDPRGLPTAFDFEGVPKQRVELIERGIARGVVYDRRTAARARTHSTGHALPAPNPYGPYAWNLFLGPGEAAKAELAAGIRRGVWVTRFHYVNVVHSRQAVLTGMTRDGTFLIEDGEIGRPVRNLRFTQDMLAALSAVRAVSDQLISVEGFFGATVAPALALERFNFSGVSAGGA